MSNDVIQWQFADDYYKYLVTKIARIDMYISGEDYQLAFQELAQIFAQINNPIREYDEAEYDKLSNLIQEAKQKNNDYELLKMSYVTGRKQLIMMTKLKHEIETRVFDLYNTIMALIDKLNMLFPKTQRPLPATERVYKKYIER